MTTDVAAGRRGGIRPRLLSAVTLGLALVAVVCFCPAFLLLILLTALAVTVLVEFYEMLRAGGIPSFRVFGSVCGAAVVVGTFWGMSRGERVAAIWEVRLLLGIVLAMMVRQFPQRRNQQPLMTIACTLLGVLYVPYLLGFFAKLAFFDGWPGWGRSLGTTGACLVLYAIAVVKCADMGAYSVGKRFGRHPLFRRLSPGKTWEGVLGGEVSGLAASLVFLGLTGWTLGGTAVGPGHAVILGLGLPLVGVVGDLAESQIKRAVSVKDSGGVVPGIGGGLDLLDSLLFAVPVFATYADLFLRAR